MVRTQIQSVIGRVLRDEIDLLHTIGNQRLRFLDDVSLLAAAMRAAHPGNDAEAAWMIAALGNFQVGKMFRRQTKARRLEIRDEDWARGDVEQWLRSGALPRRRYDGFG